MKPTEKTGEKCISCGRMSNKLNNKKFCIMCRFGYGGNPKVLEIPARNRYDHLSKRDQNDALDDEDRREND